MTRSRWMGTTLLLLCVGISSLWSYNFVRDAQGETKMIDFGAIYYGARCGIQHIDPYDTSAPLREFTAEGGRFPTDPIGAKVGPIVIRTGVNLPTSLFLLAPFALLPWGFSQTVWMVLTAALLALAASLIWDLGANAAPVILVCLAGLMLANCEELLVSGNLAGIAVSLCVVAVWCFLTERHSLAGVLLLAISLVLKPHDSGFVWLYFLLAGGALRKRALQTLAVVGILGLLAAIWIAPSSPHWIQELHRNLSLISARGGLNDPGPSGLSNGIVAQIISMQAVIGVLRNDPRFYNLASYLIVGSLILVWSFVVLRKRASQERTRLALAAIAVLSLLPVYHRPYDAKLLLLALPACAMLWKEGGPRRWIALALTSAGILVTSDIPITLLLICTKNLSISASTLAGKMMTVLLLRPAPLILLALGCFYLWVYAHYNPPTVVLSLKNDAANEPTVAATAH